MTMTKAAGLENLPCHVDFSHFSSITLFDVQFTSQTSLKATAFIWDNAQWPILRLFLPLFVTKNTHTQTYTQAHNLFFSFEKLLNHIYYGEEKFFYI